jgi:ankyrin repeat protein
MNRLIVLAAVCGATALHAESSAQPLFEALRQSDTAKVQEAVTHGTDVHSRDDHGNTLLMQAAVYSTPALMEFLLAHGADPKAANKRGYTALMRAMPDLVKIKMLVERGADVNAASEEGMTPIIIAASIPTAAPALRYLIQKGANLQAVAQRPGGGDAVMIAATQGAVANLKILLDAGANGRTLRRAPGTRQPADEATEYALERVARAKECRWNYCPHGGCRGRV